MRIPVALTVISVCGCVGAQPGEPEAAPPAPSEPSAAPAETATGPKPLAPKNGSHTFEVPDLVGIGPEGLTFARAQALVDQIEAGWPPPADDPLRHPRTLDDAMAILKLDQTNLFGAAVSVAAQNQGLEGLAVEAQLELAWGESYTMVIAVLQRLIWQLDQHSQSLAQNLALSETEARNLESLRLLTQRTSGLVQAFQLVWVVHVSRGMHLAREVMRRYPESYLGYRLAADYYRTTLEWERFEEMVAKAAERNPSSNGLRFLRGAAAFQRDADRDSAAGYYREALANDPNFVRAQAHLVVMQQDVDRLYEEFRVLEQKNPNHPLVRWAGGLIEVAHRVLGRP
jgi:tetratricopeptide (TPR) repeat protein